MFHDSIFSESFSMNIQLFGIDVLFILGLPRMHDLSRFSMETCMKQQFHVLKLGLPLVINMLISSRAPHE
jgi:hypothetical protein